MLMPIWLILIMLGNILTTTFNLITIIVNKMGRVRTLSTTPPSGGLVPQVGYTVVDPLIRVEL